MKSNRCRRITTAILAVVVLAASAPTALGKKKVLKTPSSEMDEHQRAVHALNRLTFGPRPADIDRVMAMGVDQWIDLELHPERIDDSALNARLASLRTLRMDNRELVENFPSQPLIKAVADGKLSMPSDPEKHAVYMAQLERYEERQERKQEAASSGTDTSGSQNKMTDEERERKREQRMSANQQARDLAALPPDQRMKAILKMPTEEQMALASLKPDTREQLIEGLDAKQRETLLAINNPQQVVSGELVQGKLLHAIYGERQLQEVMDDFWLNHFNVFIGKGADRYMLTSYERDVIRPHAMGKFEDLLVATAQSPAMLFYLDNWLSVGPDSDAALGIPRRPPNWNRRRFPWPVPPRPQKAKNAGLNENYGRELMELHTLGVNGGYTQHDVTEVARVFTGWTLKDPRDGGTFVFEERRHEPGDKYVLGHRIKSKGEREGLEVLHILAHHPSTAKFISTKLAMRFVSDDPPEALVDRMAQTFLKKNGDIREVLQTMFESPAFWAPEAYRAKVKTPLEFVVSAVRASGAEVTDAMPLAYQLQTMGMQLYGMQPPTGYSMKADAWVNSSALLGRMNFALALTGGKVRGVQVDPARMLGAGKEPPDSRQSLRVLENSLLAGDVSKQTHDTVESELEDPAVSQRKLDDPVRPPNVGMITGLLLGSPEFQRR
jgi:uncharacterized protein (DUF1800 family)